MSKRVLSIGQCGADHASLSHLLSSKFSAEVQRCRDLSEALTHLQADSFDLVLVNRILDADGSLGLNIIETLKQSPDHSSLPVMLVSNFADAQESAVAAGALPGFGKSELHKAETIAKLQQVLG